MLGVKLRFISGRYHATPWGHHVNEGVPEWPPSSWRFLRALVAVWKKRCHQIEMKNLQSILEELKKPPHFDLPPATQAHTRHYMPWDKDWHNKRGQARTMIFDTFVCLNKSAEVRLFWPHAQLSSSEKTDLQVLLQNMPYFGRAESWLEASLVDNNRLEFSEDGYVVDTISGSIADIQPEKTPYKPFDKTQTVEILVPDENISFEQPIDFEHPLCVETNQLRKVKGVIDPPYAKWETYDLPMDILEPQAGLISPATKKNHSSAYQIIRFQLTGSVLPRLIDTLKVGTIARKASMSICGSDDRKLPILAGKDAEGKPLQGHKHTYFLSADENGDGKLDHLTLFTMSGYDKEHVNSLANLEKLYGYGGKFEVKLLYLGEAETTVEFDKEHRYFGAHKQWTTVTPFMLSRYPGTKSSGQWKTEPLPENIIVKEPNFIGRFSTNSHMCLEYGFDPATKIMQKDGPLSQLLLFLKYQRKAWPDRIPELEAVEFVPEYNFQGHKYRWLDYQRYRQSGPDPVNGKGYGFKLYFESKFRGPLVLGHSSHFGLGLFRGVKEN